MSESPRFFLYEVEQPGVDSVLVKTTLDLGLFPESVSDPQKSSKETAELTDDEWGTLLAACPELHAIEYPEFITRLDDSQIPEYDRQHATARLESQKYVRVATTKSRCGNCFALLTLLQSKKASGLMFFICWNCQRVFQAGVGEVKEEGATSETGRPT